MSCTKCSRAHSTVQAFLLTCCVCNRKWHHRCHVPPVADSELILRIKAHNVGDSTNSLQAWKCKSCARSGVGNVGPNLNSPLWHSSAAPSTARHDSKNDGAAIVVDDSDSDPSPSPSNLVSRSKRAAVATHSPSRTTAKVINSNLRPSSPAPLVARGKEVPPSPSSSNDRSAIHTPPTSSSSLFSQHLAQPMTTATDDDEIVVISPSQFPNKETRRNQFRHDAKNRERNKRIEHKQRQQQLLKVKVEVKEVEALASNLDTSSQEPIPQPQAPEVAGSVGHLPILAETFVGPSAAQRSDSVFQQEVNLAPHWFHDDARDIWARALRIKSSVPASRRKIRGRKLNELRPQIFNFDVVQWENRMKRT